MTWKPPLPDDATHYSVHEGTIYKMADGVWFEFTGGMWVQAAYVCFPMGKIVPAAEPAPAWAGEGPPPVGTVCEWRDDDSGPWVRVELRYLSEFTALLLFENGPGDCEGAYSPADCQFRPIRTPEQIASEEKEARIAELAKVIKTSGWESPEILAAYLDSHEYRKQVSP